MTDQQNGTVGQPDRSWWQRFTTKRFFISMIGLGLGTWLCWETKISGEAWVYTLGICIAGHHAEDILKAWKGQP